jgi:hypothetical protein
MLYGVFYFVISVFNNISESVNCEAQPFGENQSKRTASPLCFENFKELAAL